MNKYDKSGLMMMVQIDIIIKDEEYDFTINF
jgi:hypothetical protein